MVFCAIMARWCRRCFGVATPPSRVSVEAATRASRLPVVIGSLRRAHDDSGGGTGLRTRGWCDHGSGAQSHLSCPSTPLRALSLSKRRRCRATACGRCFVIATASNQGRFFPILRGRPAEPNHLGGGPDPFFNVPTSRTEPGRIGPAGADQRILLIFGLLAAGIALAGYAYLRWQQGAMRKEIVQSLETVADLKVARIASWRQGRLSDARFLMRAPAVAKDVPMCG